MSTPPAGRTARLRCRLAPRVKQLANQLPGALAPPLPEGTPTPRIAIIGSGFGGIAMGCRLRQAGIETFTMYEKAAQVGGTWRDNTYPGAACDVPSHLYSLSFAPKTDWTRRFPEQAEILDYLNDVVERFGLRSHLRLGTELISATWVEGQRHWSLAFADGSTDEADVVVASTGQLNRPHIPDLPGLTAYQGTRFHSARWEHTKDLTGHDVAVIGIGASAIQFVPQIAPQVRSLTLYQRSSNYVAPKPDGEFSADQQRRFARYPAWRLAYRFSIWARFDLRIFVMRRGSRLGLLAGKRFQSAVTPLISEGLPAAAVLPDYPVGCKRILIANDWYPTLLRPNVHVVSEPIDQVTPTGVVAGGRERAASTIIFGTGFTSTKFLAPITVTGRDGVNLADRWSEGAEAHLGITVSGFPNLFLLYGPNTNLGHNSIVFMIERQVSYALTLIRRLALEGGGAIDVRPSAQARSNARLQAKLGRSVWAVSCTSWYKTATGKITNNWSGSTLSYAWRTLVPRRSDFEPLAHSGRARSSE